MRKYNTSKDEHSQRFQISLRSLGLYYSPEDKQNLLCMNFPFGAELYIISW